MRPVEHIARTFAAIQHEARNGTAYDDAATAARDKYVKKHWPDHEGDARRLLRSLKGQPPHITDAAMSADYSEGGSKILDALLEAMARS